ncbi:hypothetical protein V1264_020382 [Littorina saxatilis]|uniref:Uncharacterized protein n=2 Tax=Littorina saxatilis TaxID=31220 RepID=A0AAN9GCR4_9CAEN
MYTTSRGGFLYCSGYETCSNGCCGSYPDFYCCSLSTAAVAGIVLGCIVLVFLCSYCLKKKSHSGRVIRPVQPTNNTIVYTGMSGSYPMGYAGPPPQYMPAPPPYKRHDDAPPAYATHNQNGHNARAGATAANPYQSQPQQQYPASEAQYPAPPQYNYGQGQGWSTAGPSTAAGPPSTATAPPYTTGPPPTAVTSVRPTASSNQSSTMSRQRHSYGQGQGWSTAASNDPPATAASTARPPSTAAPAPPSTAASGGLPSSRLPPLPQLPND